jgi:hypothetical protein
MSRNESSNSSLNMNQKLTSLGFWSAVIMTIAVIFSGITASTAMKIPSLVSGIILIPVFILLIACIHEYSPADRKFFSRLGLLFTMGYAVLIGFNYYMELTLVRNNLYTDAFAMDDPQSIMWVIEVLGYGFMGLATLATAFVFTNGKLENAIRWLFIVNGILGIGGMIGYALGLSLNILAVGLIIWDIVMPISSVLLAILFRRALKNDKLMQPAHAA